MHAGEVYKTEFFLYNINLIAVNDLFCLVSAKHSRLTAL